jgi:hypothetical protein
MIKAGYAKDFTTVWPSMTIVHISCPAQVHHSQQGSKQIMFLYAVKLLPQSIAGRLLLGASWLQLTMMSPGHTHHLHGALLSRLTGHHTMHVVAIWYIEFLGWFLRGPSVPVLVGGYNRLQLGIWSSITTSVKVLSATKLIITSNLFDFVPKHLMQPAISSWLWASVGFGAAISSSTELLFIFFSDKLTVVLEPFWLPMSANQLGRHAYLKFTSGTPWLIQDHTHLALEATVVQWMHNSRSCVHSIFTLFASHMDHHMLLWWINFLILSLIIIQLRRGSLRKLHSVYITLCIHIYTRLHSLIGLFDTAVVLALHG